MTDSASYTLTNCCPLLMPRVPKSFPSANHTSSVPSKDCLRVKSNIFGTLIQKSIQQSSSDQQEGNKIFPGIKLFIRKLSLTGKHSGVATASN